MNVCQRRSNTGHKLSLSVSSDRTDLHLKWPVTEVVETSLNIYIFIDCWGYLLQRQIEINKRERKKNIDVFIKFNCFIFFYSFFFVNLK